MMRRAADACKKTTMQPNDIRRAGIPFKLVAILTRFVATALSRKPQT